MHLDTYSALEALRNALYKFKTYLLTYLLAYLLTYLLYLVPFLSYLTLNYIMTLKSGLMVT